MIRSTLALAFALTALAVLLTGTAATSAAAASSPQDRVVPEGAVEDVAARTLQSKTWRLPSGEYMSRISTSPIHYVDADGKLQDIDTSIVSTPAGFVNEKNTLTSNFGLDGSAILSTSDATFAWVTTGAGLSSSTGLRLTDVAPNRVTPEVAGDVLSYPGFFPDATNVFTVYPNAVKHDLVLDRAPSSAPGAASYAWHGFLSYPIGMSVIANGGAQTTDFVTSSGIQLVASDGNGITLMPITVYDAAWNTDPLNRSIGGQYRVSFTPLGLRVSVEVPLEWLQASDRAYPVTIDPTWTHHPAAEYRTYVQRLQGGADTNEWLSSYLRAGQDNAGGYNPISPCWGQCDRYWRTYIRYPLSGILDKIYTISAAEAWIKERNNINSATYRYYAASSDSIGDTSSYTAVGSGGTMVGTFDYRAGDGWTRAIYSQTGRDTLLDNVKTDHVDRPNRDDKWSVVLRTDPEEQANTHAWKEFEDTAAAPDMYITYSTDDTKPVSSRTVTPSNPNGENSWYNAATANVKVDLRCTDSGGSTCQGMWVNHYRDGAWAGWTWVTGANLHTITSTYQGYNLVRYQSEDKVQNWEDLVDFSWLYDSVIPNLNAPSISGTYDNGWYKSSVTVTLTASDSTSQVGNIYYKINTNGTVTCAWTSTTCSFTLSNDGSYDIQYWVKDQAGNQRTGSTFNVKVDKTVPTLTKSIVCSATGTTVGDWCRGSVTTSASGSDGTSLIPTGYPSCSVSGPTTSSACSNTLSTNGKDYVVTMRLKDNAGNWVNYTHPNFGIDTGAPTVTAGSVVCDVPGTDSWCKSTARATVSITASDSLSGLKNIKWKVGTSGTENTCTTSPCTATITAKGQNKLYYWAEDNLGNKADTKEVLVKIDPDDPSLSYYTPLTGTAGTSPWWTSPSVSVRFWTTDALSNIVSLNWQEGSTQSGSCPGPGDPVDCSMTVSGDGTHSVTYWSYDGAGNKEGDKTLAISIDSTPPTSSHSPPAGTSVTPGWFKSGVTFYVNGSDSISDVTSIGWQDNVVAGINSCLTKNCLVEVTADGDHTVQYWAVNGAGLQQNPKGSVSFKIDKTAPVTTPVKSREADGGGWYRSDMTVTLTATDAGSLVKNVHYKLNGAQTTCAAAGCTVPITEEKLNTLEYWATDNAGNEETHKWLNISVDKTATTTDPKRPFTGTTGLSGWYVSDVTFELVTQDTAGGSGRGSTNWSINGAGATAAVPPNAAIVSLSTEKANNSVLYWSYDVAGNRETDTTEYVSIDKTAPASTPRAVTAQNGKGGWYRDITVVMEILCSDATSGCLESSYSWDNTNWFRYDSANRPTKAENGKHTFYARSKDKAGLNESTAKTTQVWIDKTPPAVVITPSLAKVNGWYPSNVSLTLTLDDPLSGPANATIEYTTNCVTPSWTTYNPASKPYFNANGHYRVCVRGEDVAGNVGTGEITLDVDVTNPTASLTFKDGTAGRNGWYVTPVNVTMSASDNQVAGSESGVAAISYMLTDKTGTVIPWTRTTTVPTVLQLNRLGFNKLEVKGEDVAGHVGAITPGTWNVDTDKPTSTLNKAPGFTGGDWHNVCVDLTFSGNDATSGLDAVWWRKNGGAWSSATTHRICETGTWTINYNATDLAGNTEATKSSVVKVDRNAPTCTILTNSPPNGLNGWYTSSMAFRVVASDGAGESGVSSIRYRVQQGGVDRIPWTVVANNTNVSLAENGQNVLSCEAYDVAGNRGTGADVPVKIDTIRPTHSMAISPQPANSTWVLACADLTFTGSDVHSGPEGVYWRLDGGAESNASTTRVCAQGVHSVVSYAKDVAGNVETPSTNRTVRVDTERPTCTVAIAGGRFGTNGWYVVAPNVWVNATDPGTGSGLSVVKHRIWAGSTVVKDWTALTPGVPFELNQDGRDKVECQAFDVAGWDSLVANATANIDRVAPTTTPVPTGVDGVSPWKISCGYLNFTVSDATSGLDRTNYSVGGGAWKTYVPGTPVQFCDDGVHWVQFRSYDKANNEEAIKHLNVSVDRNPPTTTGTPTGTRGNNGWWRTNVSWNLVCQDGTGSGCDRTEYKIDGANWERYLGDFTVRGEGPHTLRYRSVDRAGLTEPNDHPTAVDIDTVKPGSNHTFNGTMGSNQWYTSPVVITLVGDDLTSGVERIEYELDGQPSQVYSGPLTVSTNSATHSVRYRAIDYAGNEQDWKGPYGFKIDRTAPTTTNATVSPSTGAPVSPNATTTWYMVPTAVQLTCTDQAGLSGCASTEYRRNAGSWSPYSSPVSLAEGNTTFESRSRDGAGNLESNTHSTLYRVDTVPATANHSLNGTLGGGSWYRGPVAVTLTGNDATSGVYRIEYKVDNGSVQTYSGAFTVSSNGYHTVDYRALDRAGHQPAWSSVSFKIDQTAPTTANATVGRGTDTVVTPSPTGWYTRNTDVKLTCTDQTGLSGCATTEYRRNNAATWSTYTAPVALAEGNTTFESRSTDVAGNVEANTHMTTYRQDTVAPVTTMHLSGNKNGDWYNTSVTITSTAVEATSGLKETRYRLDSGANLTLGALVVSENKLGHTITMQSTDLATNWEPWLPVETFNVDTQHPTTTPNPGEGGGVPGRNGWWVSSTIRYGLHCADQRDLSGCYETRYQLDGAAWATYASPVLIQGEGEHTICWKSEDVARNHEPVDCDTVYIDSVVPNTWHEFVGPTSTWAPTGDTSVGPSTGIELFAEDDTSQVQVTKFTITHNGAIVRSGDYVPGEPIYLTGEMGLRTITYWSEDVAGNEEPHFPLTVMFDPTAPVTAIERPEAGSVTVDRVIVNINPAEIIVGDLTEDELDPIAIPLWDGAVVVRSVNVTVSATDESGVARVAFRMTHKASGAVRFPCADDVTGPDYTCYWSVLTEEAGDWEIKVTSWDKLGNTVSVTRTVTVVSLPASTLAPGSAPMTGNMVKLINGMNACVPEKWETQPALVMGPAIVDCIKNVLLTLDPNEGSTTSGSAEGARSEGDAIAREETAPA